MSQTQGDMLSSVLEQAYNTFEGSDALLAYSERHRIGSLGILTVHADENAAAIASYLAERITGKTVVELGGGIGLLAMHMGQYAKRVYCIEANPVWAHSFVGVLLEKKPKNVSYLFGAADEFMGRIRGDVCVFCTHSDVSGMKQTASMLGETVIDVYGEVIANHPDCADPETARLRSQT